MTNTIGLLLYGASFATAVTLKSNSYSAESALAQLEASVTNDEHCLCFRYANGVADNGGAPLGAPSPAYSDIEQGGYITDTGAADNCVEEVRPILEDADPANLPNVDWYKYVEVTNQACLYKLWMCSCWASQTEGCLCAKENADNTVTMVRPSMGVCPVGTGKLLNPKAQDTGGYALKCAPNPCLACCACSQGICKGTGDPFDDDEPPTNCCDCCGDAGGYTCGTYGGQCGGGCCLGGGGIGGGLGGSGGSCGGGGGGRGGGGGGCAGAGGIGRYGSIS